MTSLTGEAVPMQGLTPFTRTGSWHVWLWAVLLSLLVWKLNAHRSDDNVPDEKGENNGLVDT